MSKLACYERDVCISEEKSLKGTVYSLDGYPHERNSKCESERGLSSGVGLPACNCCDCFIVGEEEVVFIEDKVILKKKEGDKVHFDRLLQQVIMQVYGGMAVLGRFAFRADDSERKILNREYYSFLVVLRGEDSINSQVFDYYRIDLKGRLKSVLSKTLNRVDVIFPSQFEEEIKRAIHPRQPSSAAA